MVIKAIVFDVGDVVLSERAGKSRREFVKKFGFDGEEFMVYAKKNLDKSYVGKLDARDFFGNFACTRATVRLTYGPTRVRPSLKVQINGVS